MSSLKRRYYQEYVNFKQSDAFKSLSAEERAQINKTAKETYKQLSDNEAPILEGQELRDQRGVLSNVVTDLTAGMVNLGRSGVSGAAWAADAAGFPDAARILDEKSQQMGETSQMISPPADPNRLVDFGFQALAQNAPTLAAGGILARLLTGSAAAGAMLNNARNAAGIPSMAGAAPLSEGAASFLSTTGLYGIPAARQANVGADGEIRAGNPYFELAAAVPYALIENTLGITPLKTMRAFSGGAAPAGVAKTIAASAGKLGELLEKPLFELSGKAGIRGTVGAFSRFVAENILGESTEEILQAIEETAIPHFAKKPIGQAIRDTMTDLGKPEVVDLLTQAKGGAVVGSILGAGNSIARKITSISDQINDPKTTPEDAQKLAAAKKQLKEEMLQLTYDPIQPSGPTITEPTMDSYAEPEGELIHPQQTFGGPAPEILYPDAQPPQNIGTEGTMRDYAAYQQDKQATREEQNATPMAVLRKIAAMKSVPDSDPQKQRFMKFLAERNWLPQEATEYPAGRVGHELQALDAAEMMPETLVSAEATPETPLLPYQPNQAEGRILADNGGVVLPVKTEDFIMPKSGRPFANQKIARAYQTKNNLKDTHDITPVRGGFALMKKAAQQAAKRITVETPRGGTYDKMNVRTEKNIPTEKRTRFTGAPGAAERIEKRLAPATAEQADKKHWWIDADDMPVFTTKSDSMGYRGPYSKQEIKDLTEVDPAALTEKNYGKEATLARREQAVTKNGYKVESYQGGFRVLDPEGKQYSWHTNRQAADDKAAELTSGKTAPVIAPKAEVKTETKPVETQPSTRITAENAEMLANAQRLRKSAASLLEQAQGDLNRDRQTNTARRARMAAGATDDALNREAFAKTMNNLADAMERGEVRYLKGVKSRPDLTLFKNELTLALGRHARKNDKPYDWYKKEPVTDAAIRDGAEFNRPHPYGDWFDHAARELETIQGMKPAAAYIEKLGRGNRSRNVSLSDEAIGKILDIKKTIAKKGIKTPYQFARILETVEDYQKLKAAGIKSDFDLADALIEYRNLEAGKKQESPLVKAERELIGKKFEGFDFFPTPPALAERMAQELDIKPGMKVLEPSAGKGDLADAVKAAQPEADVKVIEPLSDLREILTMKNHEVIDTNFENFETDQKFDRIIMNPPFSKNRDIKHVRKAYELLAPGGKMVAIMGNHFTFANDKESVEFRDWLDAAGGTSESLGQVFAGKDAFRQTGVNSQLVTIEKPAETIAKAEPAKTEVSGQTVETPSTASDLVRPKDPIQTIRDVYNSNSNFRRGQLNRAFIGRVTRALAPMGVDKWKIDLAVTNIKQRNARAGTGVMTWINDDNLIAELLKAGDIKRPAAAVVQTEDRARVDLVKPEEKDFASATDYLKALTAWREKTGNLTAVEVKRRDRALRYADRAVKTGQKASGLFRQADKISERFYMGQPILVGHHSERGARAAQNRMHNKMDAALKEEKKAEYYSQRAESAEKNKSISSADEDAIVKLKAKLESLSKVQERMKQANKVVKASKLSDAEKITKLQEQGFSEAKAKNLLEKDFAGRVGFPAYALQNNNAEMSRLKKRIEELSVKQSQQTQKIEFDGGEIVDNVAENRLQIFFDSKPDEATREKLKSNGFRWVPSAGAWQMHRSTWANRKAESITGAKIPAAQPAQAATAEDKQEIKPESAKEPLYSFEYLVADYAAKGLKEAAKVVRAGFNYMRTGLTRFADWAKVMLKQFGKYIGPKLRAMFADLTAILKSRTGAISGRPASTVTGKTTGQALNRPAKMKDFQWKKENFRTVNLEYTSPDTGKVTRVAKLLKVNNKWFWADTKREFLTLATAAKTVKSEIFEKVRNTEREQLKIIEEARARREAKMAKTIKKTEAYLSQPTAAEQVTKKELPVTVADKISTFADRVTRALFDRRLMLKKVQKLIELVSGKKLPDWANPYDRFDVIDGRIETNKGEFKDKYWQPIMADLDKAKISYEDFNNFVYAMHAPERNKYINEINPGFREKGVAGSGWSNEKAAQVKAELFAKYGEDTLMEAGKKFWAMHSELLNKQVEYGLIDEEIKGIIDAKYKYYTPLKRIKDDTVILDARALGRRSEAQDQLMFSLAAIDTTFGRGEHNRVMQAFARMALLNPADQFYEIQKDKLKPYFDERTGEVQYRLDLWADRENTIHAKFGGRDVAIVIKDKDLLTAIKTKKSEAEPLFQVLRPINRILSAANTAFNPDFILTNIFRDIQTAAVHASDAESWEMAKGILSAIPGSVKTSWQHHRGIDNENVRMYKEFLREGGKTGYSEIYQLQSLAERLEKEMAERQSNGAWYKTKQGIGKFMETVAAGNDIAESATRFAGFQAARKSGMTAQKAAVFAKNLTINFNKKGTYGTLVNTLYVFGNAALQGSHLTARLTWNMAKTNKGRIALASMIALGAMSDFINRLISDFDDEEGRSYYDKISSDIKDNNFIVMLPGTGGNYMSFPMAYGLNILPSLGRNASSYLFGDQTLRETAMNILGVGMGAFNPMGNDNRGFLANLTPTALKPLHDLTTNTKWSGRKIRPDQPVFGADLPQSELYFDQTSKPLVRFTKWLNEAFGGNKYESSSFLTDLSPADLQHLIETFSGGVGKTIVRGYDTVDRVVSGKPVQVENVPVIRRFIGKARDFNVYDEFRANAQIAKRFETAKSDNDKEWLNNNREYAKIDVMFKNVQKAIKNLRKNSSLSDEARKEKELLLQKRFNKNVRGIMQKNLSKN